MAARVSFLFMKVFLRIETGSDKYYLAADVNSPYGIWSAAMILAKDSKLGLELKDGPVTLGFSVKLFDTINSRLDFRYFHEIAVNKIRSWIEEITTCKQKKSEQS